MSRVSRLAGGVLFETGTHYFLIGNTKEPCDFARAGFEPPGDIDAVLRPVLRLSPCGPVELAPPWLVLDHEGEGEAAAHALARRLLIRRNGSVSERLWRLILCPAAPETEPGPEHVDARWLLTVPEPIWEIVRDSVLRCV